MSSVLNLADVLANGPGGIELNLFLSPLACLGKRPTSRIRAHTAYAHSPSPRTQALRGDPITEQHGVASEMEVPLLKLLTPASSSGNSHSKLRFGFNLAVNCFAFVFSSSANLCAHTELICSRHLWLIYATLRGDHLGKVKTLC